MTTPGIRRDRPIFYFPGVVFGTAIAAAQQTVLLAAEAVGNDPKRIAFVRTFVQCYDMVDEAVSPLFDWDEGNRAHCQKHGVSIAEIEALLCGTPRIAPDLKHAHLEDRLIAIGRTAQGRPLFVAFTIRERFGQPTIRPVSARYMHEREARNYEAQSSEDDH